MSEVNSEDAKLLELVTFGHLIGVYPDGDAPSEDGNQPEDLGGHDDTDSPETAATSDDEAHHPDEATDADIAEYEQNIADVKAKSVENYTVAEAEAWASDALAQGAIFTNLIDSRFKLARNFGKGYGPGYRFSMSRKKGMVIHFAGEAQNRNLTALQRWQAYARYHVSKNWGGGFRGNGISYHMGAAENGDKHWLFEFPFARWHVGVAEPNNFWIGVNNPFGLGQRATKAQLRANFEIVSEWLAYKRLSRYFCRGHNYFNATACPDSLTGDFIKPYHRGANFGPKAPSPDPKPGTLKRMSRYRWLQDNSAPAPVMLTYEGKDEWRVTRVYSNPRELPEMSRWQWGQDNSAPAPVVLTYRGKPAWKVERLG